MKKLLLLGSFLSLPALVACSEATVPTSAERPNILWIVAEDVSPWMSMWGDNIAKTPTFDKMADEGVTLMQVYSPNPICSPTRSALMTGRWPTSDGVHNHRRSRDSKGRDAINLPKGNLTLPEIFQANGYETFNIGKDDYNFVYDRRELYSAGPDGVPGHIGELQGPDFNWVELAKSDKPFFGQIQLRGGKTRGKGNHKIDKKSVVVPPYYPDIPSVREKVENHYVSIVNTDKEVAKILKKLEETGEADNTAVFFISDHGMGGLRHKQFIYDGGIHVPIIVKWPDGTDTIQHFGKKREDMMSLIDLSAGALELANIKVPEYFEAKPIFSKKMKARSYVPLSRDRADYTFDQMRGVRTTDFKYIRHKFPDTAYLLPSYRDNLQVTKDLRRLYAEGKLTPEQSVLMAPTRPEEELFDLKKDPHEINNLAKDPKYAKKLAELSKILDDWIAETGDMGQLEETETEIAAVVARWQEDCTDPRCVAYVEKHGMEDVAGAAGVVNGK